ncbi:MAG: transposase, partial [Lachnospiraceae bacterium]|nr:transposase [Lachnospiraceae bacterium]
MPFYNPVEKLLRQLAALVKDMDKHLDFKYKNIVADAGYESEENYLFVEGNGQTAFIKPANYEISKTRRYRNDIGRRENMDYDEAGNFNTCREGRKLVPKYVRNEKTETGYRRKVTVYSCESCAGCPHKTECIKGNNCKTPMHERNKVLSVSRVMEQKRKEDLERITSEFGIRLRMNRSIQAEGSFANVKEDMGFRR